MLSALPPTLVALLFALPVFSQSTTTSSHNGAFRALSLQVKKPPSEPICCLKPLTPTEPVDDGILLSFEEWKARQLAMSAEPVIPTDSRDAVIRLPGSAEDREIGANGSHTQESPAGTTAPHDATSNTLPPTTSDIAPPDSWTTDFSYAKIPITDRYNYASLDCSASVHTSHRSAKSAHHILSSKRDRYMLSPCKTKEAQFVVVELCDDIRIDTVQLANFEFFSGVFKDFTISVAKRYPTGEDGWTLMSTYRAKNMRGVQTFHPPNFLSDFYRYIRIDFHSHYSNEFYCPVSLLRVYGLTHLEEWKWELWESESRAKQLEALKKRALPAPPVEVVPLPTPNMTEDVLKPTNISEEATPMPETISPASPSNSEDPSSKSSTDTAPSGSTAIPSPSPSPINSQANQNAPLSSPSEPPKSPDISQPSTSAVSAASSKTVIHIPPVTTPASPRDEAPIPTSEPSVVVHTDNLTVSVAKASTNGTPAVSTPTPPTPSSSSTSISTASDTTTTTSPVVISPSPLPSTTIILPPLVPPPPAVKGGESIYRTIINRLAEVELNQTLYMRYFEQQNFAIRDVIKRLGEDVGRLEAITRTQSVTQQRLINDWEKQRYQMEMEYSDLVSRLEVLSEEILLEKRLGVAQLCLLLAVLVFLGLTRGSRAESLIDHRSTQLNRSVREWGKRHFTISNNWTNRFRPNSLHRPAPIDTRRSTPSHSPEREALVDPGTAARPKPFPVPRSKLDDEVSVPFPSTSQQPRTPLERIDLNTSSPSQDYFSRPRTRTTSNPRSSHGTPSLRTPGGRRAAQHNIFQRAATATTVRATGGGLQRSNSHGMYASTSSAAQIPPSGSWHGSGNPAKSAKKWARSAHLHQVKSFDRPSPAARRSTTASVMNTVGEVYPVAGGVTKGKSRERGEEDSRTPRMLEFEGENENENFFSSPPVNASMSIPKSLGGDVAPFPVSESTEIASSVLMRPDSSPPVDDADAWVDTDSIDESEVEHHSSVSEPVIPVISSRA